MNRILAFAFALAITALAVAGCGGSTSSDELRLVSATQTSVVTPVNPGTWFFTEFAGGTVDFAPSPAPLANGGDEALKFVAGDYPSGADAITRDFAGTKLAELTSLSYSTFVTQSGSGQAPYLILNVDNDGTGTCDATLFFEPVYQTGGYPGDTVPNQGNVTLNTWQTWDALAGGWWDIPDTDPALGPWDSVPHYGPPVHTLATYISEHPNAVICNDPTYGTLSISAGYGVAVAGYADLLKIGTAADTTTYNFEISTSGDCKKGGWQALGYKNQGECVSAHTNKGQKGKGTPRKPK